MDVLKKNKPENARYFFILGGISIVGKIVAYVCRIMIAGYIGTNIVTDSYFAASQLFNLIEATLIGGFSVGLINFFNKIAYESEEKNAFEYISRVYSMLSIVMLVVSLVVFFTAPYMAILIAPGIGIENNASLIRCIRILSLFPIVATLSMVCQSVLRAKKQLFVINTKSLFVSVSGIITILFLHGSELLNAEALSFAFLLSIILYTATLFITSRRFGKIRIGRVEGFSYYKSLLALSIPMIISNGVMQLSLMSDQIVISTLGTGSISELNYADILYNFIYDIFVNNIALILMTDFSALRVEGRLGEIKTRMNRSIRMVSVLLIPITFVTVILNRDIVAVIFERGQFSRTNTENVGGLLLFYALGFIPALMNNVYNQVLYAFNKMKTSMIISIIVLLVNVVLNIILSQIAGIEGIAISTTISLLCGAILCGIFAVRLLPKTGNLSHSMGGWIKVIISSAISIVLLMAANNFFRVNIYFSILYAALSIAVYFLLLVILRHEDVLMCLEELKHLRKAKRA